MPTRRPKGERTKAKHGTADPPTSAPGQAPKGRRRTRAATDELVDVGPVDDGPFDDSVNSAAPDLDARERRQRPARKPAGPARNVPDPDRAEPAPRRGRSRSDSRASETPATEVPATDPAPADG